MNDRFPTLSQPTTPFDQVRSRMRTLPLYIDVDLSTARSLAGGTALVLPIAGNVIYIDPRESSGQASIHLVDDTFNRSNTPLTVFPGFQLKAGFTQILVANTSQPGLTLRIVYGTDLEFVLGPGGGVTVTNPITVVDGAIARTLSGVSFVGQTLQAAVAGQYAYCQLWNPAGSGRNLVVHRIAAELSAAGPVTFGYNNATLGALYAPPNPISKLTPGLVSTAENRVLSSVTASLGTAQLWRMNVAANLSVDYVLPEPIVITPGFGLHAWPLNVNVQLAFYPQFWERAA